MQEVEARITIGAEPDAVFEAIRNVESFPRYMPDVRSVKLIGRDGDRTRTRWEAVVDGAEFVWTEWERFRRDRREMEFELEEGDMDRFEGAWRVFETDGGSEVVLTVIFDVGVPALEETMGDLLADKIRTNSSRMLEGLKNMLESA